MLQGTPACTTHSGSSNSQNRHPQSHLQSEVCRNFLKRLTLRTPSPKAPRRTRRTMKLSCRPPDFHTRPAHPVQDRRHCGFAEVKQDAEFEATITWDLSRKLIICPFNAEITNDRGCSVIRKPIIGSLVQPFAVRQLDRPRFCGDLDFTSRNAQGGRNPRASGRANADSHCPSTNSCPDSISFLSTHGPTATGVTSTNMNQDFTATAAGTQTHDAAIDTSRSGSTTYTFNWTNGVVGDVHDNSSP
jgi:hypothetical protein